MKDATITQRVGSAVSEALRLLLSDKHLYQSVKVDFKFLDSIASDKHEQAKRRQASPVAFGGRGSVESLHKLRTELNAYSQCAWFPTNVAPLVSTANDILFQNNVEVQKCYLPTIKTACNHCYEKGPFNPIGALVETSKFSVTEQWLSVSYQCQNCKKEPIRFLIRRSNDKLTLSGRDPFETIDIPSFIPKSHATNFRNAIIADHAGQTLAGIFLMRVFVEQFWKAVPEVASAIKQIARPTGDEIGEAYKATLPEAFKGRFPTLCEVYSSLSEAMHNARADADLFKECHEKVIEHFDARRLFKIVMPDAEASAPKVKLEVTTTLRTTATSGPSSIPTPSKSAKEEE